MTNRTIGVIIVILIIIMGIFVFMNREIVKDAQEAQKNREIIVKDDQGETKLIFDDIVRLDEEEFTATLDTSDTNPEEQNYTGIPLINVIEKAEITIEDKNQIIVRGIDGYTVAFGTQGLMDKDNLYLAYKHNGKFLKSKREGGSGPYQIIARKDQFSQRWCKFVVEIELR